MNICFEIAGKPVAKGRGRIGNIKTATGMRATIFTPMKTRDFENLVRMEATRAMQDRDPYPHAVEVTVTAYLDIPASFPKHKVAKAMGGTLRPCTKPDLDNYVKAALDGMNNIVFNDDNQVVTLHAHKYYRKKPALRIEVKALKTHKTLEDLL